MAARLPRRSFAAPFVIVTSLAGCQKAPQYEKVPEDPATQTDPANRWSVTRTAGKCGAYDDFVCGHVRRGQPPPPCNPPLVAPLVIPCPPQVAKDGDFARIEQAVAGGDCHIGSDPVACPK